MELFAKKPADLEALLRPFYEGDTVYEESFFPLTPKGASETDPLRIPLLFRAEKILSVTSSSREEKLEEGKDWILEDGMLTIPAGSAVKRFPYDKYNPASDESLPFTCVDGGKIFFSEGPTIHQMEYLVTYKHSDSWKGFVPKADPEALPRVRELLRAGKPVSFCFMGDSITTGANSSGSCHLNVSPFIPMFPELAVMGLEDKYGSPVHYANHAVGGTVSRWGTERLPIDFADEKPDLMFIAFGMNDASGHVPPEEFLKNTRTMAEQTLKLNPDCELLFCSTSLPNPMADQFVWDHECHESLLERLTAEYGTRAALVPMTSVHRSLMAKKRFYDMTGNNINHPNDFLARAYAQTILTVIG